MSGWPVSATVLTAGVARGVVLVLDEPLSFWGGYDPVTGTILDRHHPQSGLCLSQAIVVLPSARGSAGTPACIAEAIRAGVAPAGFVLGVADINIATGALVAQSLYGANCPVVQVGADDYEFLSQSEFLAIDESGLITTGDQ